MAKNKNKKATKKVAVKKTTPVKTTPTKTAPTAASETGPIQLTLRTIEKGGLVSYARPGVRASLYFNKTIFAGAPPQEITLTGKGFRTPGPIINPVTAAERAEKANAKATAATERAAKAQETAQKAKELAVRLSKM